MIWIAFLLFDLFSNSQEIFKNIHSWLLKINFLRNDNDPLKSKRKDIKDKYLLNYGESAAENIKNVLISDFMENCYEIKKTKI